MRGRGEEKDRGSRATLTWLREVKELELYLTVSVHIPETD